MSNALIAYGATVDRSADGITFAVIPEVTNIPLPEEQQDYVEVTSLDSPNGYREYLKGLKDLGEITMEANYTRAGWQQQKTDEAAQAATYYRITLSNGDKFEFQGFPKVSLADGDIAGKVPMTITIRGTGDVTFTAGA